MRGAALSSLSLGLQLPLFAQVAPTNANTEEAPPRSDLKTVELSPFEVNTDRDVGYTATSTLAGSRMNSDLRDTPSAISVMTREFLDDIAAITVNQTIELAMNMASDVDATGNSATEHNFNFRVRGIGGAQRARNYFRSQLNADLYNVERIDLARGPNSILFGEASPAGLVNTSTKFARIGRSFGSFQVRTGSYDEKRASFDYNLSLNDKAAVRVNLLGQDADGYRDFEFQKKKGIALAGTWRPFRNTQLRFEGENIKIEENRSRPWTVWDGYSTWAEAGSPLVGNSSQWGQLLAGNVTNRIGNNQVMYFQNGPLSGRALYLGNAANGNAENFRVSIGTRNIINSPNNVLDESRYPRDGNVVGPTARSDSRGKLAGIFLEQTIGDDLTFELAAGYENEYRVWANPIGFGSISLYYDANAYLPQFDDLGNQTGIVENPNAGKPIIASSPSVATYDFTRLQYRATAAYRLDFKKILKRDTRLTRLLGHHRIAGLISTEEFTTDRLDYREVNASPSRLVADYFNSANAIVRVNYYDPFSPNRAERGLLDFKKNPINNVPLFGSSFSRPGLSGNTVSAEWLPNNWRYNKNELDTRLLAAHSFFWDGRIVLLFGVRHDDTKTYASDRIADPVTNLTTGYRRRDQPDTDTGGSTRTRGIVFHATPQISLFYNEADNFSVQGARELFNESDKNLVLGNRTGEGKDAGIKLSLFGGKLYSSVAWYETADANQGVSINGNYTGFINRIWTTLSTAFPNQYDSTLAVEGSDTVSLQSKGYEFELTANPTRQLRLAFNIKMAETTNSNLLPSVQAYINANRSTWTTHAALPLITATNGALTIGELLPLLDEVLRNDLGAEGRAPVRDREIMANLTGNYTFNRGPIKGFSIGSSVQYRGESVIGYRVVTDGSAVYAPAYTMANAWLTYNRRLKSGVNLRLQLNVNNLFDFEKPQPVASAEPTIIDNRTPPLVDGLAYLFQLPTPRTYSMSATFSF